MANTIQIRRGAKSSLPTLNAGELAFCTDTKQVYVGDGTTNYHLILPPTGYDTVKAVYKNTTTITIKAGGQFTANGSLHTVAADFDLTTTSDLTTDDTLTADTWYHVVTNGTTWKLSEETTCSDVTNGVALRVGVSIYDDSGTLKIRVFRDNGLWYRYTTSINVFNGTAPTTNTTLTLSAYVPASVRIGKFRSGSSSYSGNTLTTGATIFFDDVSVAAGEAIYMTITKQSMMDVFDATITRSIEFRCALDFTSAKLWLEGWSR